MEESKINENNDHQELDLDDVAEVKKMKSKEFIPDSLIKNVIIRSKEDSQIEIKKIQEMNILTPLNEVKLNVSHRPAKLFEFDEIRYRKLEKEGFSFEL